MKIYRNVKGKNVVIELSRTEIRKAHEEYEEQQKYIAERKLKYGDFI